MVSNEMQKWGWGDVGYGLRKNMLEPWRIGCRPRISDIGPRNLMTMRGYCGGKWNTRVGVERTLHLQWSDSVCEHEDTQEHPTIRGTNVSIEVEGLR